MVEIDIQSILILASLLSDALSWLWGVYQNWKNPEDGENIDKIDIYLLDSLQLHATYLKHAKKAKNKVLVAILESEIERLTFQLQLRGYPIGSSEPKEDEE